MRTKGVLIAALILLVIALFVSAVSAVSSYQRTTAYTPSSGYSGLFGVSSTRVPVEKCEAGQDLVLQLTPFGCSPPVVRSDLLEEQDVPVFCQISATKINPLIEVNSIERMVFKNWPDEVIDVAYQHSRAALGVGNQKLGTGFMDNAGYAIIVLKKQKNSSAMPDVVKGTLTADIKYDIKNAFGVGNARFYLPDLEDDDWEDRHVQYGFWNGKGYLRAESVDDDSAVIGLYNDARKLGSFPLKKGESTQQIYIPGFDCLAGLELKLDGVENPDTRARLSINGEIVEVKQGESFLNGKCTARSVNKRGFLEQVSLRCNGDLKTETISLMISPRVKLDFPGANEEGYYVGANLYNFTEGPNIVYVYLAYAGGSGDSDEEPDMGVLILEKKNIPGLDENDLQVAKLIAEGSRWNEEKGDGAVLSTAKNIVSFVGGGTANLWRYYVDEEDYAYIKTGGYDQVGNNNILFEGLASPTNVVLEGDNLNYYQKASADYQAVINDYKETKYPDDAKYEKGEEAFREYIALSDQLDQKRKTVELCEEFKIEYPGSEVVKEIDNTYCADKSKLASSSIDAKSIIIDGELKEIRLDGIYEPSYNDSSVTIVVRNETGGEETKYLKKNQAIFLNRSDNSYIQLVDFDRNSARVIVNMDKSFFQNIQDFFTVASRTLTLNQPESFGSKYRFELTEIRLKKVARVSLKANINNVGTNATFPFEINIEKRGIKLSPDEIKQKIETLNDSINKWESRSDKLGTVVKGLKVACVATNAALTIKNFLNNLNGKAIARTEVMRGDGGWYEKCQQEATATKTSVDSCLFSHSKEIDADVEAYQKEIEEYNTYIKGVQEGYTDENIFGTNVVDTQAVSKKFLEDKREEIRANLKSKFPNGFVEVDRENISVDEFITNLDAGRVSLGDLRDLYVRSSATGGSSLDSMMKERLKADVKGIEVNAQGALRVSSISQELASKGYKIGASYAVGTDSIKGEYNGETITRDDVVGDGGYLEPGKEYGAIVESYGEDNYLFILDSGDGRKYGVTKVFKFLGFDSFNQFIVSSEGVDTKIATRFSYTKVDASAYNNKIESSTDENFPVVRYFETEPYNGLPAIVPFDLEKGWYVSIKQTLPVFGGISAYDESGRVNSFWVCNAMGNHIEQNRGGDDECASFINGQNYERFPGLTEDQAGDLVDKAIKAIKEASEQYGQSTVKINGQNINVGKPAADIPDISCMDIMSPAECKLLFNVCDPVICPSSRCDLGGAYPVKDVIQTGISGGIALCLPNAKEGIIVPVCLTGIKAGLDNLISMQKSYKQCLETNLQTGETVGICDELHSIYMCELVWRELIPIAKIGVPKLIENAAGQNTRGGGEYLGVQSAFANADKSVDYFTQYYAANSYKAFQARSTEDAGGAVCKAYVSAVLPLGADNIDLLTDPESPPQFLGWFSEIPYTTATNPPTSQYKVFYHIYAGQNLGAYYKVYLKGSAESSFYQDAGGYRMVKQGYINKGDFASETADFTASSGFTQLCIAVNDQVECGFKQVSTEYGLNWVQDKYLKDQASRTDITDEKECVSGGMSAFAFANPNLQEGASDFVDPELYKSGITRICATSCPAQNVEDCGMEDARWKPVGYCGDEKVTCWLDTKSVKDVIKNANIEGDTLEEVNKKAQEILASEGKTVSREEFPALEKNITAENNTLRRIEKINILLEKVYFNSHAGQLFFLRGNAHGELSLKDYVSLRDKLPYGPDIPPGLDTTLPGTTESGGAGGEVTIDSDGKISIVESKNIVFKYDRGAIDPYAYFVFGSGKWYWSPSGLETELAGNIKSVGKEWIPVEINNEAEFEDYVVEKQLLNLRKPQSEEEFMMERLASLDYTNGVAFLAENAEGEKDDITTKKVIFYGDTGIFETKESDEDSIYFRYKDKWEWSVNKIVWDPVVPTDQYLLGESFTFSEDEKNLFYYLSGVDRSAGVAKLFDLNLDDSFGFGVERSELKGKIKCEDCGEGWLDECTENECKAIAERIGRQCIYNGALKWIPIIGNPCKTVASGTNDFSDLDLTCVSAHGCSESIGEVILEKAKEFKEEKNIDDKQVQEDTGAASFECLVLQVAMQESRLKQCIEPERDGDPLYCDGDKSDTLKGAGNDYGVMQINTDIHDVEAESFIANVDYGINLLLKGYNPIDKTYVCNSQNYVGWEAALRAYNGWNTDCSSGDPKYVENVLLQKDDVAEIFPECNYNIPLPLSGEKIWEISKRFVEEGYNTQRYLEGNQIDKSFVCARFVTEVLIEAGIEGFVLPPQGYCPLDTVGGLVNALDGRDDFVKIDDPAQFEKGDLIVWAWDYTDSYKHMTIFDRYGPTNKNQVYVFGEGGRDEPAIQQFYLRGQYGDVFAAYRYVGE
jgi:hypothetical protein